MQILQPIKSMVGSVGAVVSVRVPLLFPGATSHKLHPPPPHDSAYRHFPFRAGTSRHICIEPIQRKKLDSSTPSYVVSL